MRVLQTFRGSYIAVTPEVPGMDTEVIPSESGRNVYTPRGCVTPVARERSTNAALVYVTSSVYTQQRI